MTVTNGTYSFLGIAFLDITVWGTWALFRVHIAHSESSAKHRMSGEEANVDADSSCNSRTLTENDVAGASLNGKDPTRLTIPQLKRWLLCRDASTKGKKADLVARSVHKFKAM